MRAKFQDIEMAVNERMKKIFDQLNERGKIDSINKLDGSTNAMKIGKKRL